MGRTKKKSFQNNINTTADIFKALGHPARLEILNILLEKKHCTCGGIVDLLPLSQSTVSKHLLELKKVELIGELFDGKKTIFYLKKESLSNSNDYLYHYLSNCKYANVFNAYKNIITKGRSSDKLLIESLNSEIKTKQRVSSSNLKSYNYVFNHLKVKKTN